MAGRKFYAGIDHFRLAAAVMVIAIHTAPFSGISETLDFLITYCVGRVAVPFFLMTTGYFVLGSWKLSGCTADGKVIQSLKKTLFLYAAAFVLYLPVNFYSGGMPESAGGLLRMIFFDGAFYHLWYFPAVIIGCILAAALLRRTSVGTAFAFAVLLYIIGAGGDSYFGLVSRIPAIKFLYGVIFAVSSYTRNGIFYAPVFLLLGVLIRKQWENRRDAGSGWSVAGLIVCMALMLAEGCLTYSYGLQRHNSMYLFLIPVMYFLFRLLLCVPGRAPGWTRDVSMLVYIIHPAVLIALRGAAGICGLTPVLVDNALVQFFSVTIVSFAAAAVLVHISALVKKEAHRNE